MKITAMHIRARLAPSADDCIMCTAVGDTATQGTEDLRDTIIFFYVIGHHDEASGGGLLLCKRCMSLLEEGSRRFTRVQGGVVLDVNAAKVNDG